MSFLDTTLEPPQVKRPRRNPAPFILGGMALLLVIYYALVAITGAARTTTEVPIENNPSLSGDYLTLRFKTDDIDLTNKLMQTSLRPIPHGSLVGAKSGEISEALRVEVVSGGSTTSVVTVPGESIVDPTAVTLGLDRGDTAYPFDEPFSTAQIKVTKESDGSEVPFDISMENAARPWVLKAVVGTDTDATLTIDGTRDPLAMLLVSFYMLAILLTTLMAVVTIGTALLKRKLEFSNIIWLSATMLSFPSLRSAMPGAPPIGTAMDFIFFFPCIVLIAVMLVWCGAYLLWRESSILRRRTLEDEDSANASGGAAAQAAAADD